MNLLYNCVKSYHAATLDLKKESKMLIISLDFVGTIKRKNIPTFLSDLRGAPFGAIPEQVKFTNDLKFTRDCIAIHLNLGPKTMLGRSLKPIFSGLFPKYLALMFFSAKPQYIPHSAKVINGIATAAAEVLKKWGIDGAAWAMPLPKGKWLHTSEL